MANASKINDGACIFLLGNDSFVKKHKLKPKAVILGYADYELPPEDLTESPIYSANKVLK